VDPNASPVPSITLMALSLAGFSLDNVYFDQVLVKDIAVNDAAWFQPISLAGWADYNTPLSSIPLGSLPSAWVDCTKLPAGTNCATTTLTSGANAIVPTITLYDLLTTASTKALPQVAGFTLGDYLQTIIPPEAIPWEFLNLGATPLQNAPAPADREPPLTYLMTLNVKGGRSASTTVSFKLPPGFLYSPGSFTIDGVTTSDPVFDTTTNTATLTLGTLTPGMHQATLDARAGLTLGLETCPDTCAVANATADKRATRFRVERDIMRPPRMISYAVHHRHEMLLRQFGLRHGRSGQARVQRQLVEHVVEDLEAQMRLCDLVDLREGERHAYPHGVQILPDRSPFVAEVPPRLLDERQEALVLVAKGPEHRGRGV
jgi:hypothetical protein